MRSPDPARHARLRELLHRAADLDGPARERLLAGVADLALRRDAERLLSSPGPATEGLAAAPGLVRRPALLPGQELGTLRIGRHLGTGGMGSVYEGRCRATGQRIAVKVIHPYLLLRPDAERRFTREAELGARVEHPNVVRTLGAGRAEVQGVELAFLVLEYVEGRTLADLLATQGPLPDALLRELAAQAAAGLVAIHGAGIVHRDIKPENLLITNEHRLRIMDLGISRELTASTDLTIEGQFVGSLLYASPEQCEGKDVGTASDIYSLGVVFHELAAGTPPVAGGDVAALLAGKSRPPPSLTEQRPGDVSPFLAALVESMLACDPPRRPTAQELAQRLAEGEDGAWWRTRREPGEGRRRPAIAVREDSPLRGRDAELAHLEAAWTDACGGDGRIVLLMGEGGIGKTRLLSEFVRRHESEDLEVLYGAWERGGAAGGPRAAFRRPLDGPGATGLLERALEANPSLIPALRAWARREPPPEGSPRLDRSTTTALLARVLSALAEERPVLLLLDDAHTAGREDLRLLAGLGHAIRSLPVLAVVTLRGEAPAEPLAGLPHVTKLPLPRLAEPDARLLVRDIVGPDAHDSRVDRVARMAEGVPLFLRELAQDPTEASSDAGRLDETGIPSALLARMKEQTRGLSSDEAEVLDVAAVEGHVFDAAPLARVRGGSPLEVLQVLARLERRHRLVRSFGRSFRFEHRLLQEVTYRELSEPLRREIHRLLAEARVAMVGGDPARLAGEDLVRFVEHHLRGSEPERTGPWLAPALDHLEAVQRPDAFVAVAERALQVVPLETGQRVQFRYRLGRQLHHLGRLREARVVLGRAVAEGLDAPAECALARTALGYVELDAGRYGDALEIFRATEAELGRDPSPRRLGDVLSGIGQAYWHLGRRDEARAVQNRVIALGSEAGLPRLEARGAADLGVLLHECGRLAEAERTTRRALQRQREVGDARNVAVTLSNLGNILHDLGRELEAAACYEESLAACRALPSRSGEAVALLNLGEVRRRLGAHDEARAALQESERICRETGLVRELGYVLHARGLLEAARGEEEEARASLREALEVRERLGDARGRADTRLALAAVADAAEARDEALGHLVAAEGLLAEEEDPSAHVLVHARRAALAAEDPARAVAAFEAADASLRHEVRLEGRYLLWRATGEATHLAAARALLDEERARLPPALATSMADAVLLHRAIVAGVRPPSAEGTA